MQLESSCLYYPNAVCCLYYPNAVYCWYHPNAVYCLYYRNVVYRSYCPNVDHHCLYYLNVHHVVEFVIRKKPIVFEVIRSTTKVVFLKSSIFIWLTWNLKSIYISGPLIQPVNYFWGQICFMDFASIVLCTTSSTCSFLCCKRL